MKIMSKKKPVIIPKNGIKQQNNTQEQCNLTPENHIIKKCEQNIYKKILHISDIHIEPDSRIEEYEDVFSTLYIRIQTLYRIYNKLLIVITGDILDKKETIKSPGIMVCRKLLSTLAFYGDVVIIAGNHDINERNADSNKNADPLTVATDRLTIHYLRYTGLYEFGNIIFCVSSLCDGKFIKHSDIVPISGKKYIALYHGSIHGAVNDKNILISSSRSHKISDFDGYDAVLLGDIHKCQIFGKNENIAYAGSLIQRNHGESLKIHGFLLWDCNTLKSPEYYLIPNKWGFVDIVIDNGKWINNDIIIPENPYIKVHLKNCEQDDLEVNQIIQTFLDTKNLQKCTFINSKFAKHLDINNDVYNTSQNDDIIKLIKTMLHNENPNMVKTILDMHDKYYKEIKDIVDFEPNPYLWRPISLEFENLFIFKNEVNSIDFTNPGVYAISAKNANGKSSIKNIILFALFGKVDMYSQDILNNMVDSGYVKLIFQYDVKKYIIVREIRRNKNRTISSKVTLDQILPTKLNLSKSSTETNQYIVRLVGSYKKFVQYNLLVNDLPSCDLLRTSKKNDLLKCFKEVFNLDVIDEYNKRNNLAEKNLLNKIQTLRNEINTFKTLLGEYENSNIENELCQCNKNLESVVKLEDNAEIEYKLLEQQKNILYKSISKLEAERSHIEDIYDITDLITEYKTLQVKYNNTESDNVLYKNLGTLECKFKEQVKLVKNFNKDHLKNLKKKFSQIIAPSHCLEKLQKRLYEIDAKIQDLNNYIDNNVLDFDCRNPNLIEIENLSDYYSKFFLKKTDMCCGDTLLDIITKLNSLQKENNFYKLYDNEQSVIIKQLKSVYDDLLLTKNIDVNNKTLIQDIELEVKYREYLTKKNVLSSLSDEQNQIRIDIEWFTLQKEINSIEELLMLSTSIKDLTERIKDLKRLEELKNIIDKWEKNKELIVIDRKITENIEDLQLKVDKITAHMSDKKDYIKNLHDKKCSISSKKETFKYLGNISQNLIEKKISLTDAENMKKPILRYRDLMDKSAIPMKLLSDKLKYVEDKSNAIIYGFTKYKISIKLSKKVTKTKDEFYTISIRTVGRDKGELYVVRLSGFESTVVNLAIKYALNQLSYISKSTFFCIDEKTDCFDVDNFNDKLPQILDILKKHYKLILMVSQRDISDMSDYFIKIEHNRNNNTSRILSIS